MVRINKGKEELTYSKACYICGHRFYLEDVEYPGICPECLETCDDSEIKEGGES